MGLPVSHREGKMMSARVREDTGEYVLAILRVLALVIRRIRVWHQLKLDPAKREGAERVLGFHAEHCPVARTLTPCLTISIALAMEVVWQMRGADAILARARPHQRM